MKILHISRSIGEFSYHESIIRSLCGRGHEVHALFDRGYSENVSEEAVNRCRAEETRLTTGWSIRPRSIQRRLAVALHEVNTFASFLTRDDQSRHYLVAWERLMPSPLNHLVKFPPIRWLLGRKHVQKMLREMGYRLKPDPDVVEEIRKIAPDVIVASPTNMRFSIEAEYLRAARSLGIRTLIPVFSWDNLTNKGLLPVIPDTILAWNDVQAAEAKRVHSVPGEQIVVTGSPFFDKWFARAKTLPEREAFFRKVGLDPDRPVLCYLGSTNNVAPNESWLVQDLMAHLKSSDDARLREMQILVRPHPRNAEIFGPVETEDIRIWPKAGALPDSAESLGDFAASLGYSVAAVGVNTTGMLDAIVADTPVLTALVDEYRGTQESTSHFRQLLDADVLEVVKEPREIVAVVGELLDGIDRRSQLRKEFVRRFIRPHGLERPAGEVAAEVIEVGSLDHSPRRTAA